ncbi:membrane protein [Arsukibacterium ikkense]|uniref:Membrane protein n=1 Tax=Arsukibacterium ikkense TaxID=336831 RepID=A0A0M2V0H0_9GAMM|nr:Mpo1-like protein [Arsukibacterium ikkense]KKO44342.1 membrane protein [Arsukibacterium ikkense]
MKTLTEHLSQYALYHRDQRNINTHYVGIPLIVVAIFSLLSLPLFSIAGVLLTPALLLFVATALFYLRLDLRFGLVMLLVSGSGFALATYLAAQPFALWLGYSLALFFVGWVLQFIGHYYEGKKPAFVDDIVGLFVGPLFIVAEAGFALGLRKKLQHDIEQIAGKVH